MSGEQYSPVHKSKKVFDQELETADVNPSRVFSWTFSSYFLHGYLTQRPIPMPLLLLLHLLFIWSLLNVCVWMMAGLRLQAYGTPHWEINVHTRCALRNQCAQVKPAITTHTRRDLLHGSTSHLPFSSNLFVLLFLDTTTLRPYVWRSPVKST